MGAAVIRIADWVIAWEKADRNHVHRREVDIAFVDDMITFNRSAPGLAATADRVIDGKGCLMLPGLLDVHSHPEHEPLYRSVREEHGPRPFAPDDEARAASADFAYCELVLRSVTSLVAISPAWGVWIDLCAKADCGTRLASARSHVAKMIISVAAPL